MSAGSSIEKTRKSPSSSSSTVACRDAPGVFLYAASSASSSAVDERALLDALARARSRGLLSMISWLMLPTSRRSGCPARSRRTGSSSCSPSHASGDTALVRRATTSPRNALAPGDSVGGAQRDRAGRRRSRKCAGLRSGRSRPGDETSIVYSRAVVAQQVGDALAERVVDARRVVDVDAEAARASELDGEHLDARQSALDCGRDLALQRASRAWMSAKFAPLHKKWAPRAHFPRPLEMWCEECSTGSDRERQNAG